MCVSLRSAVPYLLMARPDVVQVQFSSDEAKFVRDAAEAAGLSQSAFIRRIVVNKIRIRAWWVRPFYNPALKVMALRSSGQSKMHDHYADFYLELIHETGGGDATYSVYGNGGLPLQQRGLEAAGVPARDLYHGRVMMAGDRHTLWRVARSVEDNTMGDQLNWFLERDHRDDLEASWVDPPTTDRMAP